MPKNNNRTQSKNEPQNFEKALQELGSLVEQLERGELSLEDSLKLFERGVSLTRLCQTILTSAEQKVQILGEKQGQSISEPFDLDADVGADQ